MQTVQHRIPTENERGGRERAGYTYTNRHGTEWVRIQTPELAMSQDETELSKKATSDRSLLIELHRGQDDAATQLYLRYADRLRNLATRQTAGDLRTRIDPEDIVQSVFRTFFRRAAEGHYHVPEGDELWKLFLVIALNKIRRTGAWHHASRRDSRATQGSDVLQNAVQQPGEGDEVSLSILNMVIDETLSSMPSTTRDIIQHRIEGHEVQDIAQKTGRSKRSVERVLQEFRAKLGTILMEEN
ncbi:MAG: sigma-70 family RNA polymerase sigma factor [Planctomycetia bacterium]|nr:sigma-70 family RNA polymerase sigma factor [Planctomycetia bacterium]